MKHKNRVFTLVLLAMITMTILASCGTATGIYIGKEGRYYRGQDGKNHIGFLQTDEGVRYFAENGVMFEDGTILIDGHLYGFSDGLMLLGWQDIGTATYYFDSSGQAVTGIQKIDGKSYLFDEDTCVLIGEIEEESPVPGGEDPVDEPSDEPSDGPGVEPSPSEEPDAEPSGDPGDNGVRTAAIGALTGNDRLDAEVKKLIDELCDPDKDDEYNLGELFDWMVEELNYKYLTVDLSKGYYDELVYELAEYVILHRRGSCEHQAALMAVFAMRLGHESIVVPGEFLSDDRTEWVEHAWVIANVNGSFYHFDPLFGRNHTGGRPRTFFMKKDVDIEDVHRWDRDAYPVCE